MSINQQSGLTAPRAAGICNRHGVWAIFILIVMHLLRLNGMKKLPILMKQAAVGGIAAAQADYGLLVYQGAGVERDIDAAARWFEKSANNGDKEGQFLYAFTLAKGEGVEQSYEEAYYWLLKSGNSGVDDKSVNQGNSPMHEGERMKIIILP